MFLFGFVQAFLILSVTPAAGQSKLVIERAKPGGRFFLTPSIPFPQDVVDSIRVFDRQGNLKEEFLQGAVHETRAAPAFDNAGNFVFSQWHSDDIKVIGRNGSLIRTITGNSLDGSSGLCISPSGDITVGSYLRDRISFFALDGTFLGELRHAGTEDPHCVAYDRAGNLFVGSRNNGNGRIAVFDSELTFERYIGEGILVPHPIDMQFDKSENLWVAMPGSVRKFAHDGTLLDTITHPELDPAGIALDENELLYVPNWISHEVFVFAPDGLLTDRFSVDLGANPHPDQRIQGIAFEVVPNTNLACDLGLPSFYAQTSWPGVHRDPSNSDFAPFVVPRFNRVKWTALHGVAVLAHPSIGPEGNVYVVTGQGPGSSHLHAFDRHGSLLWESDPQGTPDGLDSAAVFCAPVIDLDGDVYVSDSDQFWAFHPDGSIKWVIDLPQLDSLIPSAVITNGGLVGGVTINGEVIFVERSDGSLAVPVFELPGGSGPPSPGAPEGLWDGGLIDPSLVEQMFNITFGWEVEVANTPAIHSRTGRLYITAAGSKPTEGVLYGLDIGDETIEMAFATPMGGGSGTSPAISTDDTQVYAVDGNGELTAFDVDSGEVIWQATGAGAAASPAVAPDGTIFSGGGEFLLALDPAGGSVKWARNYDKLAAAHLRRIRLRPPAMPTGLPIARTNSVVSVSATTVWVVLVLGYEFENAEGGTAIQPRLTVLVAVDPNDGSLRSVTPIGDTSEGTIALGADGQVYVRHAAVLSSIFYYGVNPLLPTNLQIPGPPVAGLSVLAPASFVDHAARGVDWVDSLAEAALDALGQDNEDGAMTALCRGQAQLAATSDSILNDAGDELDSAAAATASELVLQAHEHLGQAVQLLVVDAEGAEVEVVAARDRLSETLSALDQGRLAQIDVGPGLCPNEISARPRRWERLEIAVVGTESFDVSRINTASIELSRADAVGDVVIPMRRFLRPASRFEDVTSPGFDRLGECGTRDADSIVDRVFSFTARQVANGLALGNVTPGIPLPVKVTGKLIDGSAFEAFDSIVVAQKNRNLRCVRSTP